MQKISELLEKIIVRAEQWQDQGKYLKSKGEKDFHGQMNKMVEQPLNKVFLTELIDKSFRPRSPYRTADLINGVVKRYGIPNIFSSFESFLMIVFRSLGKLFAPIAIPQVVLQIQTKTSVAILHGGKTEIERHIKKRGRENTVVNLNLIGEVVLSEQEADHKLNSYLQALQVPSINYLSIKISNIYSQISSLDFEKTVKVLSERLATIYQTAVKHKSIDGSSKFVNLDMEEYRDLEMTIEVFKRTLDQQEFKNLSAGIVLQAYLPDSYSWLQDLSDWAKGRVENGGAPIKIRLVKGANMDMEQTEASQRHWEQAPFSSKVETDAHYKKMLLYLLDESRTASVRVGLASHNIFEIAFAYEVAKENNCLEAIDFEILEGMADGTRKVLLSEGLPVLLYTPIADKDNFINSIAYFVRRLDENTAPDNFLTHSFDLDTAGESWQMLEGKFRDSVDLINKVSSNPRRCQNRLDWKQVRDRPDSKEFIPEPDTDWNLVQNREWALQIRDQWKKESPKDQVVIPLVINGECIDFRETRPVYDANTQIEIAQHAVCNQDDVDLAFKIGREQNEWAEMSFEERHKILMQVAQELCSKRGDLIGVAAAEVGKTFAEADTEVSEAIDFAEFYPRSMESFTSRDNLSIGSRGIGLVIPPWNFPIAIPAGGIIASLAAGNNTIVKPAPQSVFCAYTLCQAFWSAGVPASALQFLPADNNPHGTYMIKHPDVNFVIFTGSTKTGLYMLDQRSDLSLYAETGGKNATIVTAASDRDTAIKNVIHSAFGNSGQKCSATSLLILEKEVFEDDSFKQKLLESTKSIHVGSSWNFGTKVGPLVNPNTGNLKVLLDKMSESEWLLKPRVDPDNERILSPGIIWGIDQSHFSYQNELFAPVLSVMKAEDLNHAIRIANETGYGLTSGLETLDESEVDIWKENLDAGNLYVNRPTTGAIVMRQPFGGYHKSAIGAGIKAGGPNYVQQFVSIKEKGLPKSQNSDHRLVKLVKVFCDDMGVDKDFEQKLVTATGSYVYEFESVFSQETDYFQIRGEENVFRYKSLNDILLVFDADRLLDSCLLLSAATFAKTRVSVLIRKGNDKEALKALSSLIERIQTQDLGHFEILDARLEDLSEHLFSYERIRFVSTDLVNENVQLEANRNGKYLFTQKPYLDGRLELLNYFKEQSVSYSYHRYGNLGIRGIQKKKNHDH